ncbi:MAG: hypothetical protein WBA57_06865 [Elainellaceae cyanobacterium]
MPYTLPQAPYFLIIVGLLASITSGVAFGTVLKGAVEIYLRDRTPESLTALRGLTLLVPYWGICLGVCVFLASSVQIFAFSPKIAYAIAFPLTLLSGILVWRQLIQIIEELESRGPQVLGIDPSQVKG